jgi:exonuclease V
MASPANKVFDEPTRDSEEVESDYGSDFSPEEDELINKLLSLSSTVTEGKRDNPIVNEVEYHDKAQDTRVPRVLDRERRLPVSNVVDNDDREQIPIPVETDSPGPANRRSLQLSQHVANSD